MKQNITLDQLNELTEEGKEKLRNWWNKVKDQDVWKINEDGYISFDEINDGRKNYRVMGFECGYSEEDLVFHKILPQLSIGQMIEFLKNNETKKDKWFGGDDWDNLSLILVDTTETMCDDLWRNVKRVLEKY